MTSDLLFALAGAALFALGTARFFGDPHLLRRLLALNVTGSGTFLVLVGLAQRGAGQPPDPLAQALVLTGLVVAISATALGVVLLRRFVQATGRATLDLSAPKRTPARQRHDRR
jgi:multicomponent Na+:H+ antiporter subunit C